MNFEKYKAIVKTILLFRKEWGDEEWNRSYIEFKESFNNEDIHIHGEDLVLTFAKDFYSPANRETHNYWLKKEFASEISLFSISYVKEDPESLYPDSFVKKDKTFKKEHELVRSTDRLTALEDFFISLLISEKDKIFWKAWFKSMIHFNYEELIEDLEDQWIYISVLNVSKFLQKWQ